MKVKLKVIDIFKILMIVVFFTVLLTIIVSKTIEKTNEKNQSIEEQKLIISEYISENQTAENAKELLENILIYINNKESSPEKVPTIEYYGIDNNNIFIKYAVEDKVQYDYYQKEVKNIVDKIKDDDTYYITCENDENGYINKVIIEYNY